MFLAPGNFGSMANSSTTSCRLSVSSITRIGSTDCMTPGANGR